MKKGIFSSLILASSLFVTLGANADENSVVNFYNKVVNIGFIKGMQNKDNQHILKPENINCVLNTDNDETLMLMDKVIKNQLTTNELQEANNFFDSKIGQALQRNILIDAQNGTNSNALEHMDISQISDKEINDFLKFLNSSANKKLFESRNINKIMSQPEVKKSLTIIARNKITNCGLSNDYFFK